MTKFCYKNLIESAQGSEEMWRSLNSVLGNKEENFPFQAQNGKRSIQELKAVASKFNKFFATIGCCIAKKLHSVSSDGWKKYESVIKLMV